MWVFNCCFLHGIFSDLFLPTILIELKFLCKGNILTTWWPHVGMDLWIKDTTQTCALGINNNILTGTEFGIRVQHKDITCGWFCQQTRERQPEVNTEGFGKRPALKKKKIKDEPKNQNLTAKDRKSQDQLKAAVNKCTGGHLLQRVSVKARLGWLPWQCSTLELSSLQPSLCGNWL